MKSVLITGGCGFIGSNLVEYFLEHTDWSIRILDNLSSGNLDDIKGLDGYKKRVRFVKGDIRVNNDVDKALKNVNYLVNLAAQTSVIESVQNPIFDEEVNVKGLVNLLQVAPERDVEKLIHASSAAAVGPQEMPIHEQKVPQPISPYGASKLAGEGYCSAFAGSYGLRCVVLRFSNVYGPKSYHKGSVVAKFIKRIIDRVPLEIYGDGTQTRDFVYVKDICRGIFLALTEKTQDCEIFQLGTGVETSVNHLVELLRTIANSRDLKVKTQYSKKRPGEIEKNYADISKAQEGLDFNIHYTLEAGLQKTFRWFQTNYS
ncbi:MAG: NAD-dependent epimerase/dehydratase family protein [Promethearchaeia archaeon]